MKELTLEEAALAWAQGKRVEASVMDSKWWLPVDPVGRCLGNHHSASVFTSNNCWFRIAPEPPAKKWRPYTRSQIEKHLGAQVQHKGRGYSAIIIAVLEEAVHIGDSHYTFQNLLDEFTWSDRSPCGVEVDA